MRIAAQPSSLSSAGSQQAGIADEIVELSARLTSATSAASGAGDPGLAEAITGAVQSWQASLAIIGDSVGGIGQNLSGAGSAYAIVDESAIAAG